MNKFDPNKLPPPNAIWRDSDMLKALLVGVVIGIIIGALRWAI